MIPFAFQNQIDLVRDNSSRAGRKSLKIGGETKLAIEKNR